MLDVWRQVHEAQGVRLSKVQFVTEQSAVAVGNTTEPVVLRSDDGGTTWRELPFPEEPGRTLVMSAIHFSSAEQGWIAGHAIHGYDGRIFHTSDGGATWRNIAPEGSGSISTVHTFDGQTGFAVDRWSRIWRTTDAGESWTSQDFQPVMVYDVSFVGNTGYLSGFDGSFLYRAVVMKTEDAGKSWESTVMEPNTGFNGFVHFVNADTGYVTSGNLSRLMRTDDGGKSWDTVAQPASSLHDLHFLDDQHGFFIDAGGELLETDDGGKSMRVVIADTDLRSVHFAGRNGLAVNNDGRIFRYNPPISSVGSGPAPSAPAPFRVRAAVALNGSDIVLSLSGDKLPEVLDVQVYDLRGRELYAVRRAQVHGRITLNKAWAHLVRGVVFVRVGNGGHGAGCMLSLP